MIAPVLTQIAGEFGMSLGAASLAIASYAVPGMFAPLVIAPYSDRFGRKPFLVAGSLLMGGFTLVAAAAPTFGIVAAARMLSGLGSAVLQPNITAAIGDALPYRQRGRAISTVIGVKQLANIFGLPIAGVVAEAGGWRVAMGVVGVLPVVGAIFLAWRLRSARTAASGQRFVALYRQALARRSVTAALVATFLSSMASNAWFFYLVVFFQRTQGLTQGAASTVALTFGLGVLIGSQIGGRLGDRVGHKRTLWVVTLAGGALMLLETVVAVPLIASATLNLALCAFIGAEFAATSTVFSELVPEARGTVLALAGAVESASTVAGVLLGGLLVDGIGLWGLGVLCLVGNTVAAVVVALLVSEPGSVGVMARDAVD